MSFPAVSQTPQRKSRPETIGLALIVAVVVTLYVYIGSYAGDPYRFTKENGNYYPLLVDGFLAGRLGFKVDPPPQLVALKDPYDPVQRVQAGNLGMHDATYYKGRYYLYFGVAPAITLFLPFRLVTGYHFPQNLATVVFCVGGFLCSLGLFLALRRRFFPAGPSWVVWLGAILLGLGNFCPAMLSRNAVWEVPISSGYFFSCLGFWLLFIGWNSEKRRGWLLGAASVAFGLAVASRPHFVFCPAVLGVWWIWQSRARIRSAQFLREAAILFVPLALIVAGLLTYNYLRFENAFEFGQKYQLAGNSQIDAKLVSRKFFPINFYLNFLAPAQFERYFPFFQVVRGYPGVRPEGYGGAEDPYGVLPNMPFSWLALIAPLIWAIRFRSNRELGGWILVFGLAFFSVASTTMCFAWTANRYMVDFIPSLLLVAMFGLLMVSRVAWQARLTRIGVRVALFGIVAYTVAFNLGVMVQHNGLFRAHRPETFAALSRFFNRPTLWWEKRYGTAYGPVQLTLQLPNDQLGRAEPIMVTGVSYRSEYLYLYYFPDGQRAQLGYTRTNHSHVLSQPFRIDYRVPHRIGIQAGSLYPEKTHPYFAGRSVAEIQAAKETFVVTIDGIPYLEGRQEFFDSSPGFVTFGENHVSDYIGRKFTGKLLEVRRAALPPAIADFDGGGFLRLAVVPPGNSTGRTEALVATGQPGRSDSVSVHYLDPTHFRLRFSHANDEPTFSAPIEYKAGEIQVIDVSLGSFYSQPTNARERELAKMLVVRVNGLPVWQEPRSFYPVGATAPLIARAWEVDSGDSAFSGRIVAQQRVVIFPSAPDSAFAVGGYWIETDNQPTYGPVRVHAEFPRGPVAKPEPLVVTGASAAQADYVLVTMPLQGQLTIGYVHVGAPGLQSQRVRIDPSRPQRVELDIPSLYPSEADEFFAYWPLPEILAAKKSQARVRLNGETLWESRVPSYEATAAQIMIGEDRISKVFAPKFKGRILAVERLSYAPPAGLVTGSGPLELDVSFPSVGTRSEALLATGENARWDTLLISYDSSRKAHLIFKGATAELRGDPFTIEPGARARLSVVWGGLYPDSARPEKVSIEDWKRRQRTLEVSLNGSPVLRGSFDFVHAVPQGIRLGQSAPAAAFSGIVHEVKRGP